MHIHVSSTIAKHSLCKYVINFTLNLLICKFQVVSKFWCHGDLLINVHTGRRQPAGNMLGWSLDRSWAVSGVRWVLIRVEPSLRWVSIRDITWCPSRKQENFRLKNWLWQWHASQQLQGIIKTCGWKSCRLTYFYKGLIFRLTCM